MFPKWMMFEPGVAPIVADGVTYAGVVAVGHAVMRLIAGPAIEDRPGATDMIAAEQALGADSP